MSNTMLTVRSRTDETVPMLKKIPNFENYGINELGKIYNLKTGHKISTYIGIDNYEHCILFKKGKRYRKRVHRLMGVTFLGNPQVVNHIDGNKSNNIISNLEKSSHSHNIKHAYDTGVYKSTKQVAVKITNIHTKVSQLTKSMREAERITGVDRHRIKTFISNTRNNYTDWIFEYFE